MPHWIEDSDEGDEDDFWSADDDDETDSEADEEDPTVPCPYCRRQIHEESQRCPYCGNYISIEDAPASRKPVWFIVGLLACLSIVILWIVSLR
jgi:hypothetical protein